MNVLFLSLLDFDTFEERNIYTDLLREFIRHEHQVVAISPFERKCDKVERIIVEGNSRILKVKIGNAQKVNFVEKGVSTVLLEHQILAYTKKKLKYIKFDFVLYTTPPVTFKKVIDYFKKRDNATTFLLLKDIFPQNAVDLGILSKRGVKGIIYRFFRKKERDLYRISDYIGCMSPANVAYVLAHNKEIESKRVMVCPNSIDVVDKYVDTLMREKIRRKYEIPIDKTIFIYGGNLGKPQGIPFIIDCFEKCKTVENAFFLIVGDGTEYGLLESYATTMENGNVKVLRSLPKEDYDTLVGACDVGLIFLEHGFTIPNFPSRLLSYMQAKLPVFAVTDANSDIGETIANGNFGWWCESNDANIMANIVREIVLNDDIRKNGQNAWNYLNKYYSVEVSYSILTRFFPKICTSEE